MFQVCTMWTLFKQETKVCLSLKNQKIFKREVALEFSLVGELCYGKREFLQKGVKVHMDFYAGNTYGKY
jgi:hypothetical protein